MFQDRCTEWTFTHGGEQPNDRRLKLMSILCLEIALAQIELEQIRISEEGWFRRSIRVVSNWWRPAAE